MTTQTLPKLRTHACTRCKGDLLFEPEDETYVCLQCGRRAQLTVIANATSPLVRDDNTAVIRAA